MPRRLLPREHGAYVQLAAPLVAAFLGGVTLASVLIALGACIAFVAHESLLVALGHRGRRALDSDGARARRWLAVLVPLAAIAGLAGLALARAAITPAAVVAICAALLVVLAWRREERSLAGELVAAVALSGAAVPVAVAAHVPWRVAAYTWLAWSVGYAATVIAVHRVIARHRQPPAAVDAWLAAGGIIATVACLVFHVVIAIPLVAASTCLVIAPPSSLRLRAIGVALVGVSLVSIAASRCC